MVRAYTNPTDLNFQDSMGSMEWPAASEGECKVDPTSESCFIGIFCKQYFEYSYRFALNKQIHMNQEVRGPAASAWCVC